MDVMDAMEDNVNQTDISVFSASEIGSSSANASRIHRDSRNHGETGRVSVWVECDETSKNNVLSLRSSKIFISPSVQP